MKKLCLIYSLLLIPNLIFAQSLTFSKVIYDSIPFSDGCQAYSIISAFDSGNIIAGEKDNKALIIKTDTAGNIQWSKIYGSAFSLFNQIIPTSDSCYLVTGLTQSVSNLDAICMKINMSGDTIWSKKYGGPANESYLSVEETFDKGFILAGYADSIPFPGLLILISRIDSSGNLLWSETFLSGNNTNIAYSARQTPDSGFVFTGFIENYPPYDPKAYITKLTPAGAVSWSKTFEDSTLTVTGNDISITNDGLLLYLTWDFASFGLLKLDFNGNTIWSKKYTSFGGINQITLNQVNQKMHVTHDSCFIFVHGSCWGSSMTKVDSTGNVLFNQSLILDAKDIAETDDHGFMVLGNGSMCALRTSAPSGRHLGLIKTDSLFNGQPDSIGGQLCIFPTTGQIGNDILNTSNIIMTPVSGGLQSPYHPDIIPANLINETGCVLQGSDVNENSMDENISVFPIPASDNIQIRSDISIDSYRIYDLSGKIIANNNIHSKDFQLKINSYAKGIYFLELEYNFNIIRKKIIKG